MTKRQHWNLWSNIVLIGLEIAGLVLIIFFPLHLYGEDHFYGWDSLKFYTTDSNLLLLISTTILVICLILVWTKKIKKVPEWVNFFKLMSTGCTTLTMMAVLLFTPFATMFGFEAASGLFMHSNTFYHLLCPLFGIVIYLLFEERSGISWQKTLFCMIPTFIYAIYYMSVALTHIQHDLTIPIEYDWYCLSQINVYLAPLATTVAIGASYLFTWCLWYGNKKIYINKLEKKN